MIDLSYLTEEEQEMILSVLKRDADLKKAEEQRVKNLQKQERDKGKLKYLTGEWFYETKSRRHRDRIHGSDIIRASISRRKPVTILELSQMWAEKPSFVNSENQDVYVPPELSGLLEEPQAQHNNYYRDDSYNLPEEPQDMLKSVLQSPTKQRQNPFNSTPLTPEILEDTDSQLPNEAMEQTKTPDGEFLPPSEFCIAHLTNLKSISSENIQSAPLLMPVPKTRTIINKSQDSLLESPAARQASFPAPRSILKQSSSTDSLQFRNACSRQPEPQSPQTLHSPSGVLEPPSDTFPAREREPLGWIDRKQVRFGPAVSRTSVEWPTEMQDGKELGEHSLLDLDCTSHPEGEEETGQLDISGTNSGIVQGDRGPLKEDIEVLTAVGSPCWLQRPTHDTLRQVDLGEGLSCREKPDIRCLDTGPAQVPADQLEHRHAEYLTPQVSDLHCAEQETGHDENLSPIRVELKQMSSRPLSRSLEEVVSPPKREERSTIHLSVDDVSAVPPSSLSLLPPPSSSSLSVPEQMKNMSKSVSALQDEKDGRDSDCTSVKSLNFSWKKRTGSSLTNLSLSSGMASMSSVSGSVASIYSGVDGNVEVKGTIRFALNYVQKLGEFHIFVVHCRDLAVAEPKKNRSDPYVKCYLLPDIAKMGKRKTSVKKKTLNPTYNEILRFKVTMETLKTRSLNVSMWHNDNFGRNSFLGEVDLDLSEWDFSNTQMNDYALKARISTQSLSPSHSQSIDHRGMMRIGLRFLPQISYSKRSSKTETGEVQIWVKDCKNLPAVRGAIMDPFVKCTVLPDTSRKSRQKTRVVKKTANPMFNHTMVYDGFRPDDLREACVEVTVWDHDRLANHFIGGLRLGLGTGKSYGLEVDWMDSTSEEASFWERMMHSHNEWVEDVLPLRMLIMARS
ncbi:synaptotagmin-like protein 2 isoform X3 [Coregonus clupeaformis]|uniref:synaptotagmin-like protein 2 isoform X3 n=1 Tax=Coregonus clupeaformis TaxID=59861 RepID=UPI001BE0FE03|nr:synaptotagmin-like protein 2 isoform X3 [Coregonus clupeaformis]